MDGRDKGHDRQCGVGDLVIVAFAVEKIEVSSYTIFLPHFSFS